MEAGYRLIDTAQFYENEKAIGDALKILLPRHNLQRSDIFITSKMHPRNMLRPREAFMESHQALQVSSELDFDENS